MRGARLASTDDQVVDAITVHVPSIPHRETRLFEKIVPIGLKAVAAVETGKLKGMGKRQQHAFLQRLGGKPTQKPARTTGAIEPATPRRKR